VRLRPRSELAEEGPGREGAREGPAPEGTRGASGDPAGEPGAREPAARERPVRRRRALARHARNAGAAAAGTAGAGVLLIARLVMFAATLIALLVGLAIVLRDVDANASNTIVKGIHEGANFFAGAFTGLIRVNGNPKRAITLDWGIALLVYLIVGGVIARAIAGIGRGGLLFERRHRAAPMA
jgi:hypothetical protein